MSELEEASVRVYLGGFPPDEEDLCSLPYCLCTADRVHAWIIDGELYTLWLCRRCRDLGASMLAARPTRARVVSFDDARESMAADLAKLNAGKIGRRFSVAPGRLYPLSSLERKCPACGAAPRRPCVNPDKRPRRRPHPERRNKYQPNAESP